MTISGFTQNSPFLKEGRWRGTFHLSQNEVPFVFEVRGTNASHATIFLINGKERTALNQVVQKGDSVIIPIELYDAVLAGKVEGNRFTGTFKRQNRGPKGVVPFSAEQGNKPRFQEGQVASCSLNGTWDVKMTEGQETEKLVGLFNQKGALLTGTFLSTSGDFRYFEGTADGKSFSLSAFSGSNPTLIKGRFSSNDQFTAQFITPGGISSLVGTRNDKATLPDPYSLTKLKQGYSSLNFSFPDLNGKLVSLKDPKYKGKVVIVSIMGSWCPNCNDEISYLAPWYKKNRKRGVEIIGLAFERKKDFVSAKVPLTFLKNKYGVDYDILFAGQVGPTAAAKALPALDAFFSYPTTIFIDKKGNVRKIHAGYNGPATGRFYDEFLHEFNQTVDDLLKEN
jgi:thiol-disulfide isomerase/thioredoxin